MNMLMTRDEFREAVFRRDNYSCVICREKAQDAHHIIERRLFSDGGYYLDNGASLCGIHHLLAESTELTCEEIRERAGISSVIIPSDFYPDFKYDKWGNPWAADGTRFRGPLYSDSSVRKIIVGDFVAYTKYPRTLHLPWSSGTSDDRIASLNDLKGLFGVPIIITEKMDGENTNLYGDYIHARSFDYNSHPSRNLVKALHSRICGDIPNYWRICGENLYAKHSIEYTDLEDYFMVFSIWDHANECLSWAETEEWCSLLGLSTVPVLWRGKVENSSELQKLGAKLDTREGYVVRLAEKFPFKDFSSSVFKSVRPNHVTTSHHWKYEKVIPNKLKGT